MLLSHMASWPLFVLLAAAMIYDPILGIGFLGLARDRLWHLARGACRLWAGAPSLSALAEVRRHDIRPGNSDQIEGNAEDHPFGVLIRSIGGPQRESERCHPDRFIKELDEKQWQHLQRISNSQRTQSRQGGPEAQSDGLQGIRNVIGPDKSWPDVCSEQHEIYQVQSPQHVQA